MISPIFTRSITPNGTHKIALLINVISEENVTEWCSDLGSFLSEKGIKATLFFVGKIAEKHPQIVEEFNDDIDIGSLTFSYVNLTSITDYTFQLEEVLEGKRSVDRLGGLSSKLFSAPYGSVNDDIYSQLTKANITVDFSYSDHYNKYYNGQFIRVPIIIHDGAQTTLDLIKLLGNDMVAVRFNNTTPIKNIVSLVLNIQSAKYRFLNASEITGLNLTLREAN